MKNTLAALLALAALSGNVSAGGPIVQSPAAPQAYVGLGATVADRTGGSSKVNPKFVAGYALNDSLAIEGGYVDFRRGPLVGTPAPEARTIDLGGFGAYVAARFTRPLFEKLSAYGKLGIAQSERKLGIGGLTRKESDTGAYAAFGLQYSVTKKLSVTAEVERYGKDKKFGAKSDAWTVGLKYDF